MKPYMIPALAATIVVFGACKNGPNNARDTSGMPNNSAAGSVGPGSGLGPGATTGAMPGAGAGATTGVTPPVDTMRDTTKKKPYP